MKDTVKYPDISVELIGNDGNAFAILGRCKKAMTRAECTKEQIQEFIEEATSGDYDNVLHTCMRYFDVQ